jgi:biotin carboxyl carrier protein
VGDDTGLAVIGQSGAVSLAVTIGGDAHEAAVVVEPGGRVTVDGEACTVIGAGPDAFRVISADGRQRLVYAVLDGEHAWVGCEGIAHRIRLQEPSTPARYRADAGGASLTAPMPATVVRVHVSPDQAVQAGDLLISLEAMKMELPIRAPAAGVVKAVFCRVGELVQPDVPLLEMA